ncbi:cupin domain-containing protein [Variovorax sp. DXTD-1]|uniref:cupin domain-containing protein n=1 Tax=Variovorax sp. DXTD-1 TaxID=2495592 RepID=UPI000F877C36|nr:cupin domain-containing protein [Variovorax sp. DXTD-1]RST51118.1 cupin domain-containing protein [Variovorax sp. DXTD-1]
MKNTIKRLLGKLSLVAIAATAAPAWATSPVAPVAPATPSASTAAPETLVSMPAKDIKWREIAGTGGIRAADMRGSITGNGPYEAFVEFPAGKNNPPHVHTQSLPTVVLSGVFYAIFEDGKKVLYPAGSYYYIPGKLAHRSGCEPGANCVLFQYQADHFDLVPTKAQ